MASSSLSVEECRSLGFVTTDLICGACDDLDQFNLSSLKENCLKCCQKEEIESEALKVRRNNSIKEHELVEIMPSNDIHEL